MGKRREILFEKECIAKLQKLRRSWWPGKAESNSIRGILDRIGCVNGRFIAIEFKRSLSDILKGSKSYKLQEYEIQRINSAGGYAVFCCPETWPEIYKRIKGLANEQT